MLSFCKDVIFRMGLDIYHYKATLQKPKDLNPSSENYILEENYEGFDVDFSYFNKYIQLIDIPKILRTLIFAKKESELEEIKNFFKCEYDFFYESNFLSINKVVDGFIIRNHQEGSLLHKWETPKWIGFHVFELEKKSGFYYEEVGYQRKGMNDRFAERFYSDSIYCYTKKEEFEFALSCVDFYWDDDTQAEVKKRKRQFKSEFLDNYEDKRSWMNTSW